MRSALFFGTSKGCSQVFGNSEFSFYDTIESVFTAISMGFQVTFKLLGMLMILFVIVHLSLTTTHNIIKYFV